MVLFVYFRISNLSHKIQTQNRQIGRKSPFSQNSAANKKITNDNFSEQFKSPETPKLQNSSVKSEDMHDTTSNSAIDSPRTHISNTSNSTLSQGFHLSWYAVTAVPANKQLKNQQNTSTPAKYQQSNRKLAFFFNSRKKLFFFPEILWQTSKYLVSCCFCAFWTFSCSEIWALKKLKILNFCRFQSKMAFFRSQLVQVKHRNKNSVSFPSDLEANI